MFKFFAMVALLAAVASAGTLPRPVAKNMPMIGRLIGKIVNGEETTIEENPHQISLQVGNSHYCGGSIISEYWIVTAAHCVSGYINVYTVRAGTAHSEEGGSIHKVIEIIVHSDYGVNKHGTIFNDIALIRVQEPFKFDETRQLVSLYSQNEQIPVGAISVITGWGSNGYESPLILNTVSVPIISKTRCNELYDSVGGIPEGQICAAYEEGGKDACQGDSGGPLTVDGRLAGIVSWGIGCALPGQPGVYTEVGYYRDWIKENAHV